MRCATKARYGSSVAVAAATFAMSRTARIRPRGAAVRASENGVVAYAGSDLKAYGKLLLIRHADGWMTAYAHNDELLVGEGDVVRRGDTIAHTGGAAGGEQAQTYFEIRRRGKPVDPLSQLTEG